MPKATINQEFLDKLELPTSKAKEQYFDIIQIGFMLEVKSTGSKTYYFRYRKNNKQTMKRLGTTEELTLEAAKDIYLKLKQDMIDIKIENITNNNDTQHPIPTLQEFYDNFYNPYIQKHIKSHTTNQSLFINHILPALGATVMTEVKKIDIIKHHSQMVSLKKLAPATANKFLVFLSNAYHLAIEFEILQTPYNPVDKIKHFEENNARERYLTTKESKRLVQAVQESPNLHLKYIIPMLLLSGARRGEVLKAEWSNFDETQMLWTIPTSKNGKKRILPLTPQLHDLLKQIPKESKYLFTSPVTGKPYITIFNSWNTARTKAGLPEVRIHDLRHTYASALVNSKCSLYEVQKLLGHKTASMTQRYAHLSNDALMNAASKAGKFLE
ncbi:MAG: site-specific integrase [Sulfurimonas sp.]|nr:site-specific integrase [Sulfurimonas sp.]